MSLTAMADSADLQHGAAYFGLPLGQFKVNFADEGERRDTWQVKGLETLNFRRWMAALSPAPRRLIGLPENFDLIESSTDGLDDVAPRLRVSYQAVMKGGEHLPMEMSQLRHLLGRLPRVLMNVPGGGRAAINIDVMGGKLGLGPLRDDFVHTALGVGVLVEEANGYVRFDDLQTPQYFTTVP